VRLRASAKFTPAVSQKKPTHPAKACERQFVGLTKPLAWPPGQSLVWCRAEISLTAAMPSDLHRALFLTSRLPVMNIGASVLTQVRYRKAGWPHAGFGAPAQFGTGNGLPRLAASA